MGSVARRWGLLRTFVASAGIAWQASGQLLAQPAQALQSVQPEQAKAGTRSQSADRTREFLGLGPAPDAVAAERGAKLYAASCAFCHGAKATGGDTGPDLLRSSLVLHDEKGEAIGSVIKNGRAALGMPAFPSFTQEQRYDIAEFLHMRVELAANRGTYKIADVITGDRKAGELWFQRNGCSGCHSTTGDLAHIGSKLSGPDLQQMILYPSNAGKLAEQVTVTLPSGEQLRGKLKHLDDFRVSFWDEQGEYHSIALSEGIKVSVDDRLAAHRELLSKYTDADMHNITAYLSTLK